MGCQTSKEENSKKNNIDKMKLEKNDKNKVDSYNKRNSIAATVNKNQQLFSQDELNIIRSSWKELTKNGDYKDYGVNLMIKIFLKHSEVKYLWRFAINLKTEEEMRNSNQLKSHGKNLFEAINAAVNSLNNIDSLNLLLVDLGSRHTDYGAKIEHFPIVKEALLETLSDAIGKEKFTQDYLNAWSNLIDYFGSQMSKGMI